MRLGDLDALRDVTPEATYAGSIMRQLIDAAPTISCGTCSHEWCEQGVRREYAVSDDVYDVAGCSLWEKR